jgi:Family of unknown function (DUF6350)
VTDLLPGTPPPSTSPLSALPRAGRSRWLLATGAGAALAAAGSVLLGLAAVTVLLWAAASHAERNVLEALRAAGLAWLLAHRAELATASGELTIPPLLLTALLSIAAVRAAGWAARSVGVVDARSVAVSTAGFTAGYGGLAGVVALAAGGGSFQPRLWSALAMGMLWGTAAGAVGGAWSIVVTTRPSTERAAGSPGLPSGTPNGFPAWLRVRLAEGGPASLRARLRAALLPRLPAWLVTSTSFHHPLPDRLRTYLSARSSRILPDRVPPGVEAMACAVLRAGAVGGLALVGGGALVVGGSLALHTERAGQLFGAVADGWAGALGVLVVCAAYVPNAAVWAAAFGAGPGFAVGQGTAVTLAGVQLGATPALPLLAALPASGPAPLPSYGAVAVPAAAGVLTGLIAHRRTAALPLPHAAGCAVAAGAAAGVGFGCLAWLAGGSAGGRLSSLGPPALSAGLAVTGELAVLAVAVLLAARWWAWYRAR